MPADKISTRRKSIFSYSGGLIRNLIRLWSLYLRWYGMKFAYAWGFCNEFIVLVFLEGNAWGENTLSEIIEEFVRVWQIRWVECL